MWFVFLFAISGLFKYWVSASNSDSWFNDLGWGPGICICNTFPGDADAAGSGLHFENRCYKGPPGVMMCLHLWHPSTGTTQRGMLRDPAVHPLPLHLPAFLGSVHPSFSRQKHCVLLWTKMQGLVTPHQAIVPSPLLSLECSVRKHERVKRLTVTAS